MTHPPTSWTSSDRPDLKDDGERLEAFIELRPSSVGHNLRHHLVSPVVFGHHFAGEGCPCGPERIPHDPAVSAARPEREELRDRWAEAIYAGGDEPEWITTADGSPNAASYEHADRALAVRDDVLAEKDAETRVVERVLMRRALTAEAEVERLWDLLHSTQNVGSAVVVGLTPSEQFVPPILHLDGPPADRPSATEAPRTRDGEHLAESVTVVAATPDGGERWTEYGVQAGDGSVRWVYSEEGLARMRAGMGGGSVVGRTVRADRWLPVDGEQGGERCQCVAQSGGEVYRSYCPLHRGRR